MNNQRAIYKIAETLDLNVESLEEKEKPFRLREKEICNCEQALALKGALLDFFKFADDLFDGEQLTLQQQYELRELMDEHKHLLDDETRED